jgi:hypothetical protein
MDGGRQTLDSGAAAETVVTGEAEYVRQSPPRRFFDSRTFSEAIVSPEISELFNATFGRLEKNTEAR